MIHEFAVFPGLLTNEAKVALLRTAFGIETGRLISDFPQKQWAIVAQKTIEKHAIHPDERKRWIAALMTIVKGASYRRQGAIYDQGFSWIENAVQEHKRRAFRGIVHEQGAAEPAVMKFGIDLVDHPHWNCPGSCHRQRVAEQMIQAVGPLLDLSTTLVLVDRYFSAGKEKWRNVLLGFTQYLSGTPIRPHISHIHYITCPGEELSFSETERQFRLLLEPHLPAGISIGFYLVPLKVLHDRFVLTDRGGVQFGHGLDEGLGDVLITRLSEEAYEKEWRAAHSIRNGTNPVVRHRFQLRRPS